MISPEHRCIFVHIPRTGGGSLEDLIWPRVSKRTQAHLWRGMITRFTNKYQTGGLQHLFASHIREEVGSQIFLSHYKFSLVRNPWDKAVSQYAYMAEREDLRDFVGMKAGDPFKRYLELTSRKAHVQWVPQHRFLLDANGECLVDYIGRYESYGATVRTILEALGLPLSLSERMNRRNSTRRQPYQHYYDQESREIVAERYRDDIKRFGFAFAPL